MTSQQELELFGQAYRDFADSLKSQATKNAYDFCLQKYMKHLRVKTVDELLKHAVEQQPKLIEAELIEYIVSLKNAPHSLAYPTRNMYLTAILMFYSMNDVNLT